MRYFRTETRTTRRGHLSARIHVFYDGIVNSPCGPHVGDSPSSRDDMRIEMVSGRSLTGQTNIILYTRVGKKKHF